MRLVEAQDMAPEADFALEAVAVEKRYSGLPALKGVDVRARRGTIHALVGENGAGKSTFLGVIAGRVVPTQGTVRIFGRDHVFGSPRQARRLGIAAIYQELTIVPALSAQANVFLGQTLSRAGLLSEREMRQRFDELAAQMSVSIRPNAIAGRLSVADQQMLEIMRGVQSRAKLILFDEPTASLAPPERAALFRLMRHLRAEGVTMMFVSHNLDEVFDIADVITVFRDGSLTGSAPASDWSKPTLIRAMIGHDVIENRRPTRRARAASVPLLSASRVTVPGAISDVDIELQPGEILGIGGLVGSGRTSFLRALAGLEPRSTGQLSIAGQPTPWPTNPRSALRAGIVLVPEDRKAQGLVLSMSAMDNIAIARFGEVSRFGIISNGLMSTKSKAIAREFGFAEDRIGMITRNLSGGNQQKVMLGKARFRGPRILLVDEPTRGIDIGAKDEIMSTLRRLADDGLGIIVVSSDLEEIIAVSDRIAVMSEGHKVAEFDQQAGQVQVQDILHAAFKVMAHHE